MDRLEEEEEEGEARPSTTQPTESLITRTPTNRQADGKLPPAEQRGYKHVGDALLRVAREEGVLTYWRYVAMHVRSF